MKILHLSDLHIGKSLCGISLLENQEYWKKCFLKKTKKLKPDVIVIAGDVYDRSTPSVEAVKLLDNLLTQLEELQIPVMIVTGNHDSGQRLTFAKNILAKRNIYIAGSLDKELCHVTIKEKNSAGEVNFWLMPYLSSTIIAEKLKDDSIGEDYEVAVKKLLEQQNIDFSQRNVLVAHQNIVVNNKELRENNSKSKDYEQIDYRVFDGFDYVALGHIHSSYSVGRKEVRYAGSPMCYHFDETKQLPKGILLVEIGEKGTAIKIQPQVMEPLHFMREIKGTYEEIKEILENNNKKSEYLKIIITDKSITPDISRFFKKLSQKRDSILMEIISEYQEFSHIINSSGEYGKKEKSISDYFVELYRERKNKENPAEKDLKLFKFAANLVQSVDMSDKSDENEILDKKAEDLLNYILEEEKDNK